MVLGACGQAVSNPQVLMIPSQPITRELRTETPFFTATTIASTVSETSTPFRPEKLQANLTDPAALPAGATAIWVYLNYVEASFGNSVMVKAFLKPMVYKQEYYSWIKWPGDNPTITEMQVCVALDSPCQLTNSWVPFVQEKEFNVKIEWIGYRDYWVTAKFRDSNGKIISSILTLDGFSATNPSEEVSVKTTISGKYDNRTPFAALPTRFQVRAAATETEIARTAPTETKFWEALKATDVVIATNIAATWTAAVVTQVALAKASNSVVGSIYFANSVIDKSGDTHCCINGGHAYLGDTFDAKVHFLAASPFAEVKEMRLVTEYAEYPKDIESALWEPFLPEKAFSFNTVGNWISLTVKVQYRDALGNLSPVYENYILVEGW
mgnify:FL=1